MKFYLLTHIYAVLNMLTVGMANCTYMAWGEQNDFCEVTSVLYLVESMDGLLPIRGEFILKDDEEKKKSYIISNMRDKIRIQ